MGSVEELFKTSLQPPVPASVHLLAQLQLLCPPPPPTPSYYTLTLLHS